MILAHLPNDARPYLVVDVLGVEVPGLLDSGSHRTIVGASGYKLIKNLGLKVFPSTTEAVSTASGEACHVQGILDLPLKLGTKSILIEALLVPAVRSSLILGLDFWRKMEIVPNLSRNTWMFSSSQSGQIMSLAAEPIIRSLDNLSSADKIRLEDLVRRYFDLFPQSLGCTDLVEHRIDTADAQPIKQRYYPVSPAIQKIIYEELDKMLLDEVIEPSNSPWSSPILLVRKPEGKYRFCVDFRRLNAVTKKDAYPLPYISSILDRLREAKFLSSIDIKSAYWQVKVRKQDREKTAFTVPGRGLFHFKRMPFGLHNAPATWQRLIDRVLGADLEPYVFVYLDDAVICTPDFDTHLNILEKVFQRLLAAGLVINREKCSFCRPELKYLGYIVDEYGLRVDPDKVTAILNIPRPRTPKEVRQFCGTCSWYRRFVRDFSTRIAPLHNLLKKGQKFNWSEEAERAFLDIRQALIQSPVLSCPDFQQPFELHTDASAYGLGAVLIQVLDGEPRVIAYASKSLTKPQQNYSATERECLAVVWGIEKFRAYLEGTHFKVYTDHHSLKWLCSLKDPQGRLARWAIRLQPYDYEVIHKKGKDNVVPDALSRAPLGTGVAAITSQPPFQAVPDKWYESMMTNVRQDPVKYADWKVENGRLFKHQATEFDTSNPWKLVIPKADRGQILHESHDLLTSGHQGEARTYFRVNERYYWPKMRADCKRYVQKCRVCQQSKSPPTKPHGLLSGLHLPTRPWEIIATDLIGPLPRTSKGHRYICLITDVFSKYVVIKPIRNAKSKTVSDVVEIEIFLTYGVPSIILCDNGPEYRGAPFRSLADSYGVKIFFNARRHPQANPAERYNRTLIGMLRAYIRDDHRRWDGLLPKLAVALRTSTNHTTGFSPASLVFSFGYQMDPTHVRVSQESPCPDPPFSSVQRKKSTLPELVQQVHRRMEDSRLKNKASYDLRRKIIEFHVGDWVWKRNFVQSSQPDQISAKLAKRFVGPYKITRKVSAVIYHLSTEKGDDIGAWHISDLKPFFDLSS
ncbi:multicellular organismal development [Nesidiocoris tenuis]|uniref:RNA-directed DNA polymerase n=1 Tax=Nesidiocoris tenuis TaxID=355587 RepID=A0ABN7B7A5_9HEMI|nr:multicellular organismal development [Nesidiocoris tenuis]